MRRSVPGHRAVDASHDALRAVPVGYESKRRIFHVYLRVGKVGHVGVHLLNGADEVLEQIDVMERLLNGHACTRAPQLAPGIRS